MREFWTNQALNYKNDIKAVNFDILGEELEIFHLKQQLTDSVSICDLGCGNGRTTIILAKEFPNAKFIGYDYVEEMVALANKEKISQSISNIDFFVCDASKEINITEKFDIVYTKRLLINLKGNEKLIGIENIYNLLKDHGKYIMVECFIEPLKKINEIRKLINEPEIKVHFFNEYLSSDFFGQIKKRFIHEASIDFESFYYFISRIFNAYLSEGNPDYLSPINKLAVELSMKGINPLTDYAPERMNIFTKK